MQTSVFDMTAIEVIMMLCPLCLCYYGLLLPWWRIRLCGPLTDVSFETFAAASFCLSFNDGSNCEHDHSGAVQIRSRQQSPKSVCKCFYHLINSICNTSFNISGQLLTFQPCLCPLAAKQICHSSTYLLQIYIRIFKMYRDINFPTVHPHVSILVVALSSDKCSITELLVQPFSLIYRHVYLFCTL